MLSEGYFLTAAAACLRVTGEDAANFLQSQGTQDLRGPAGLARYCLWLDHRGCVQGDSWVLKLAENTFLLYSYGYSADTLMNKFARHIIADDVVLEDMTESAILYCLTPEAARDFAARDVRQLPEPGHFVEYDGGFLLAGNRLGPGSFDRILLRGCCTPEIVGSPLNLDDAERWRISHGQPLLPDDITPSCTPLVGGLLSAVSFDKGCYLGQEVVARLSRLDRSQWLLCQFSSCNPVHTGDLIVCADQSEVGTVRSVVDVGDQIIGLALIKGRVWGENLFVGTHRLDLQPLSEIALG